MHARSGGSVPARTGTSAAAPKTTTAPSPKGTSVPLTSQPLGAQTGTVGETTTGAGEHTSAGPSPAETASPGTAAGVPSTPEAEDKSLTTRRKKPGSKTGATVTGSTGPTA